MSPNKQSFTMKKLKAGHLWYKEGKKIPFVRTPNVSSGTLKPKYLVIHFTAGSGAKSAINWMKQKRAKASAHFVIAEDGSITQMAGTNKVTWHAGKSKWRGIRGLNRHSIGLEVANPGALTIVGDGTYKTYWGKVLDDPSIYEARHKNGGKKMGWLPFTPEQIMTIIDFGSALMEEYNLKEAVGHDMIAPRRKTDPGPCMSDDVYDFLNGRKDDEETVLIVDEDKTNDGVSLRKWPDVKSKLVMDVMPGVHIEETGKHKGGWSQVEVSTSKGIAKGWLNAYYLKEK